MLKKILIIGGLIVVVGVIVMFAIPWGEYESDIEKSELSETVEYNADAEEEGPLSLEELQGNSYSVEAAEGVAAEIIFDLDGLKSTKGGFTEFAIDFEVAEDFKTSKLTVDIAAKSVNTGNSMRDEHLLEEDFFNVAVHPQILFESNTISLGDTSYVAEGELTLNGNTKALQVPFLHLGGGENDDQHFEAFQGYFEFDRVAYGQEESSGVGNLVKVNFYCELVQQ